MKHKVLFMPIICWLLSFTSLMAQEQMTIVGSVFDNLGEPLIGVNVVVENTSYGTVSDFDGNFKFNAPEGTKEIVVSYIGYETKKVAVQNNVPVKVILSDESIKLEEMVVVGYATQKKVNLTGSVGTVDVDDLVSRPSFNTSSLLQGQVSGVTVVNAGAQPGSSSNIRIRGVGTIGSGANPLVLIDGVEGALDDVPAGDIENISVLKDAASCAIYGARAANGVILITTKTGTKEIGDQIKYDGSFSMQKATVLPDLLNASQYATLLNEAYFNGNKAKPFTGEVLDFINSGQVSDKLANTYWPGEVFRTSPMTQHNLSLSGSRERLNYMISLGYQLQEGIMRGTDAERFNARMNLTFSPYKWLKLGANVSGYIRDVTEPLEGAAGSGGVMNYISFASPLCPVFYSDGRYATAIDESTGMPYTKNPRYLVDNSKYRKNNNVQSKFFAEFDLYKNLVFSASAAYRFSEAEAEAFTPKFTNYDYTGENITTQVVLATLKNDFSHSNELNTEMTLRYKFNIKEKHNFNALLGYSYLDYFLQNNNASIQEFTDNDITVPNGGTSNPKFTGNEVSYKLQSLFGRLNYNFKERYLLEANFRYDGSSRFAEGNQYGFFPSFSGAWRLSEEAFFQDWSQSVLSNIKLRASWGKLGNQDIGYYPYQQTLATGAYVNGMGEVIPMLSISDLANENITWETTTVTNVGLDFGMFRNRLTAGFELFHKQTDDILLRLPVPDLMGNVSSPYENAGVVRNRGWELSLNYQDNIGKVRYSIGGNVSQIENKIIDLKGHTFYPNEKTIHMEGYPVGAFYGYQVEGVFSPQYMAYDPNGNKFENGPQEMTAQQIIDYYAAIQSGAKPGDFQYKNIFNTEAELEATGGKGEINSQDRTIIGNPFPEFEYSFNGSLAWNGFDFSFLFQGVGNVDIYTGGTANQPGNNDRMNMTTVWLNRTNPAEGIWTNYPRLAVGNTMNTRPSDFWVEDASYLRLKNVELGYNFSQKLIKSKHVGGLRVFVSGQNLLTFTQVENWDPERLSGSLSNAAYPQAMSFTVGVSAKF